MVRALVKRRNQAGGLLLEILIVFGLLITLLWSTGVFEGAFRASESTRVRRAEEGFMILRQAAVEYAVDSVQDSYAYINLQKLVTARKLRASFEVDPGDPTWSKTGVALNPWRLRWGLKADPTDTTRFVVMLETPDEATATRVQTRLTQTLGNSAWAVKVENSDEVHAWF